MAGGLASQGLQAILKTGFDSQGDAESVEDLSRRVKRFDLHFNRIPLAASWRTGCGGTRVESGSPIRRPRGNADVLGQGGGCGNDKNPSGTGWFLKVELTIVANELDVECEREESGMKPRMTADLILSLH